jgi:adenine-specific DNA-methyltransferase
MEACRHEFVDSRLRRFPPDREDAVPCGQAWENEACFPRLAHRSAAAHKLHGATAARRIDSKFVSGDHDDHKPGASLSLFSPGTCPTYRHHRTEQIEYEFLMVSEQLCLFEEGVIEDAEFLKQQLITYIGNKRALLPFIETGILFVKNKIGKERIDFLDLFSGTGVVARMARQHARIIHCNDLELYSEVTNRCYQTNQSDLDSEALVRELARVTAEMYANWAPGIIAELYAPKDDDAIKPGERVFYTRRNAIFLDTFCRAIEATPEYLRPYVLAPVLSQASMYVNTSGVFKGFYKNNEGIGQFGGTSENALTRIKRDIQITQPILSRMSCTSYIHRQDANALVRELDTVDVAYLDPPYNQHPYGSNYFMLNLLCKYEKPRDISNVSGIPKDWNRSLYNKPQKAEAALFDAVESVRAKFVLISYNSEGFIKQDRFLSELSSLGEVSVMDTRYNTFRGCRNLSDRDTYVTENLYLLEKR